MERGRSRKIDESKEFLSARRNEALRKFLDSPTEVMLKEWYEMFNARETLEAQKRQREREIDERAEERRREEKYVREHYLGWRVGEK